MSAPASTLGDEKNHATPSNIGSPQSSITDLEKTGLDTPTINDEAGDAQTPEAPADHYPHGFKLASIMFGIYMCFVIVALDSVGHSVFSESPILTIDLQDHHRNRDSKNHR